MHRGDNGQRCLCVKEPDVKIANVRLYANIVANAARKG